MSYETRKKRKVKINDLTVKHESNLTLQAFLGQHTNIDSKIRIVRISADSVSSPLEFKRTKGDEFPDLCFDEEEHSYNMRLIYPDSDKLKTKTNIRNTNMKLASLQCKIAECVAERNEIDAKLDGGDYYNEKLEMKLIDNYSMCELLLQNLRKERTQILNTLQRYRRSLLHKPNTEDNEVLHIVIESPVVMCFKNGQEYINNTSIETFMRVIMLDEKLIDT